MVQTHGSCLHRTLMVGAPCSGLLPTVTIQNHASAQGRMLVLLHLKHYYMFNGGPARPVPNSFFY